MPRLEDMINHTIDTDFCVRCRDQVKNITGP